MNRAAVVWCIAAVALTAGGVLRAQPGGPVAPRDKALIVVIVPADAAVTIGGQLSPQKGPTRRFETPPLPPGNYSYEIVATWKDGGKDKKDSRTVKFAPGQVKTVDFTKPAPAPQKKSDLEKTTEEKIKKKTDTEKKTEKKTGTEKKTDGEKKTAKKATEIWTNPTDPTLPVDFRIQGEYVSDGSGAKLGCQVIALGNGQLQAVVLPGGLPGAGWDGKDKSLMQGQVEGDRAVFTPATGKRRYIAQNAAEFSATSKFPPVGQKNYTGSADGKTMMINDAGKTINLKKIVRHSKTLGEKAPSSATILFDGKSTDEWTGGGRLDKEHGILNTDGHSLFTKRKFNNYTVHLEFMLPYRPAARGQGRGNSGFYQVRQYEVQILDSFGLEGRKNECGAIYETVAPKVNMCLPPLQWQTYDIDFTNAVADPKDPKKIAKHARITCRHNGEVILDTFEIPRPTGGASGQEGTPGQLELQGHGNPLQFRNIWIVEKK
jgi:uncharacterized protein (TIGR03000 family)